MVSSPSRPDRRIQASPKRCIERCVERCVEVYGGESTTRVSVLRRIGKMDRGYVRTSY
jgi:hypothetical protein